MEREEVKTAIYQLLDSTSEEVLQEVYDYLKTIQERPDRMLKLSRNMNTILAEDKSLLERLAQ